MKVVGLRLQEVAGAAPGARAGRRAVRGRRGLLLELEDDAGRRGLGECSPLPGYSPDRLEDGRAALAALAPTLPWTVAPQLAAVAAAAAKVAADLPAARCALETALLDLAGRVLGRPLWALLGGEAAAVPVAALLPDADLARAEELWQEGFGTFKVKVGQGGELEAVLGRLDHLRRRLGAALRLRLDANGAWPVARARELLERLVELAPELVEQPVAPGLLRRLGPSPLPLAADESLQRPGGLEEALATCRVLVLKPMVLGGLLRCRELARRGRGAGLEPVVSHLFDGPVALAAGCHLALALASPYAAGLAPHPGLAAWPAVAVPLLARGRIEAAAAPGLGVAAPA